MIATPTIATSDGPTATLSSTVSVALMVTTPPTGAREQSNDGGSDVGGIVAGCVIAFILFVAVVCVIIFLIWYCAKKKDKYTIKSSRQLYM